MNKQLIGLAILTIASSLYSCKPKGFQKLKSGLEYEIIKDEKGDKKAVEGSFVKMHIQTLIKDSVLFDSRVQNNNEPIETPIQKPSSNGDVMEGLTLLSAGDSAVFKVACDSLMRGGQFPPFAKSGDIMTFRVKMVSVQSKDEYEKTTQEASAGQNATDDKLIQEYVAKNSLTTQKTASGIYYTITNPGSAVHPVATDKVKVHYKGTLMDGTTFDSSYDRKEPAEFPLNAVIKGWTEAIPLLGVGGKGKFIIPSSLAYGAKPQPGGPIKPNSVLIFDVELLNIVK